MTTSVFIEVHFWLLLVFSFVVPVSSYFVLMLRRAVSPSAVLGMGLLLTAIAGVDVYLLQSLTDLAKLTPSLMDDAVFNSSVTMGLYVLPLLFGGLGVNLVTHVLLHHLTLAERRFEKTRRND